MTEEQWLSSTDPAAMLNALLHPSAAMHTTGRPRKLRLFACACCRAVWPLLTDERSRRAVEVAERYADGQATEGEMQAARHTDDSCNEGFAASCCCQVPAARAAENVRHYLQQSVLPATQAALLRDIVGNPWRPVMIGNTLPPPGSYLRTQRPWLCRAWKTPTVLAIAQACYDDRPGRKCEVCEGDGFELFHNKGPKCPDCRGTGRVQDGTLDPESLRVLSDALEDAGCTDAGLLAHLRGQRKCPNAHCAGWMIWHPSPGEKTGQWDCSTCTRLDPGDPMVHVRGCHALDTFLGKS